MKYYLTQDPAWRIVVTTGIKPSSNIDSALESAMYGRSSELGLYLYTISIYLYIYISIYLYTISNLHLRTSV